MNIRILLTASFVLAFSLTILFSDGSTARPGAGNGLKTIAARTPVPAAGPAFKDYRGVSIGMSMDDARAKLGTAREKSDQQDYYVVSDSETAQVLYDTDKTVMGLSISYFGENAKPPTPMEVFGTNVDAAADGAINKMVKYPKAGIWITYLRTGGSDPMVMVTIHKL